MKKKNTFPNSITSIESYAFNECTGLTSVTIPDGVTEIGYFAFQGCKSLTSVTIPESVTSIEVDAFLGTPFLEEKQAENPLVIINGMLIDGKTCSGDVTIPDGVKIITERAFESCNDLTSIVIPDSVETIGWGAFSDCSALASITFGNGVKEIERAAFSGTQWMEERRAENPLVIANGILIDGTTCEGAVTIPDGVTTIGYFVFGYRQKVTSVVVPKTVTHIHWNAFFDSGVNSVTVLNPDCQIDDYERVSGSTYYEYQGTISGYSGSTAEVYAKLQDIEFISLDNEPETNPSQNLTLPQNEIRLRNGTTYTIPIHRTGLTYTTDNPDIVNILRNGVISVVGEGTANVSITDENHNTTSLKITAMPVNSVPYISGDVNGDNSVNAADAANLLMFAAMIGAGTEAGLTEEQFTASDVNHDEDINAGDASVILMYAAAVGSGQDDVKLDDFVGSN